jgi:hypothetical protein
VYLFTDMNPATYSLTAEKPGFKTCAAQGLVLDPATTRTFDCTLQPGAIAETVEVSAGALQVETQNTQINSVINSSQIEQLPDNGRNFANFLALQPGVAGVDFSAFNSMNIFATQGVSVNGLRDQDNNTLVEGVSSQRTRDNAAETARFPPSGLFSPNGSALINVYPTPNLSSSIVSGLPNYLYLSQNPSNNHRETAKVDYQINPWNSHLRVSVRHYRTNQFSGSFGNSPQLLDWNIQEPERGRCCGETMEAATTDTCTKT